MRRCLHNRGATVAFEVFYLDDEPDLLELFADSFGDSECTITTFTQPGPLMDAIEFSPPDLLVLDYRLPGTTGDAVALSVNPDIPKVLITGDLYLEPQAKFIAIIRKPYKAFEVRTILDDARKKKQDAAKHL